MKITEKISREETLAFIEYLKNKENIILESQVIGYRTFFNRCFTDMLPRAEHLAEIIRKSSSALRAYQTIAHEGAKRNSNWKLVEGAGYIFIEDFEEMLAPHRKNADDGADSIELLLEELDKGTNLNESVYFNNLPDNLGQWIKAGITLESRSLLANYFPTEWLSFRNRFFGHEGDYSVQAVSRLGTYNGFGYEAKMAVKAADPDRISLVYDGEKNSVSKEELIPIAKLLCESCHQDRVYIIDRRNTEYIIVVRRREESESETEK